MQLLIHPESWASSQAAWFSRHRPALPRLKLENAFISMLISRFVKTRYRNYGG